MKRAIQILIFTLAFFLTTISLTYVLSSEIEKDLMYIRRAGEPAEFYSRIKMVATAKPVNERIIISKLYETESDRRYIRLYFSGWLNEYIKTVPYDNTSYEESNRRLSNSVTNLLNSGIKHPDSRKLLILKSIKENPKEKLRALFALIKSD